jgi:tripartite-type tricarboxylate transporter receptor subunit TctC
MHATEVLRRVTKLLIATLIALATTAASTYAEVYPSRAVNLIVPAAAGGPTDALARILDERMRTSLGHPVVVENVPGAAGNIGVGRVARASPDGYTIVIGLSSTHVANGAIYKLPYDVLNDFEPIALISSTPHLIVSKTDVPAKNLQELIVWLKANPGNVLQGTVGIGSPPHIAGVYFRHLTGTTFEVVPYRGAAEAMQGLLAGQIDLLFPQAIAFQLAQAGKIRAYAVMSPTRLKDAQDIPTVDEAGAPGLYASTWFAFWAPKGTSKDAIDKLNAAAVEALADPSVRKRYADQQQDIFPREMQTPEALGTFQKAEIQKWWPVIRAEKIKSE